MHRGRIVLTAIAFAGCANRRELSPIRLEPIVTLGADSGDGAMAATPSVSARHPGGFRVVIPAMTAIQSVPLAFDDRGKYLGSLPTDTTPLGTTYHPVFTRFGRGDSIWIFDNARRVHIFDPERHYVRTIALSSSLADPFGFQPVVDAVLLPDDRFAATTQGGAAAELFSTTGSVERNFGLNSSTTPVRFNRRHIALGPDGTLWTTTLADPWRLEHWDTNGTFLGALEPAASWLVDPDATDRVQQKEGDSSRRDLPPPPMVEAIWLDAAGRLWILGRVPDGHWQAGILPGDSANTWHIDADRYYDTVVEARDPKTGALIATSRFDVYCASIAEPGVLVHEVRTSGGWVRAELLRVVAGANLPDSMR